MSRNVKLWLGLVSAAGFYYFFGVLLISPPGNQSYLSIVPAIRFVVGAITLVLIVLTVREYLRSGREGEHSSDDKELSRREVAAREAIAAIHGTAGDEFGVTLFVSHHLDEVDAAYWRKHTYSDKPEPRQVLDMLELRTDPAEQSMDMLDFTLPENVTDYVVCVEFDKSGNIVRVAMES